MDIFEYMNAIVQKKELTDEELKKFQPYIAMKFLSYMSLRNYPAIKIANHLNRYVFKWSKRDVFEWMKSVTPKLDRFYMYKMYKKQNKITKTDEKLIKCLAYHYEVSDERATEMVRLLAPEWKNYFLDKYEFLFNSVKK